MNKPIQVKFKKLFDDAILPRQWSKDSVGYDLHVYHKSETGKPQKKVLPPHNTWNFSTGLAIEPPPGHVVMICSRSGLAKRSVFVANSPGIIDPDYRGEVRILLYNGGYESQYISHEDRVAQMIVVPALTVQVLEAQFLSETERGEKGLGSTGL